jgi:hypothetical protein
MNNMTVAELIDALRKIAEFGADLEVFVMPIERDGGQKVGIEGNNLYLKLADEAPRVHPDFVRLSAHKT